MAKGNLALAQEPLELVPRETAEGEDIPGVIHRLKLGDFVQVTFRHTCQPDDVTLLYDLKGRGFVEFAKGGNNERNIHAVYLSKNGWGHLPRSFVLEIKNLSGRTASENLRRLARRLERVEVF